MASAEGNRKIKLQFIAKLGGIEEYKKYMAGLGSRGGNVKVPKGPNKKSETSWQKDK